MSRKKNYGEIIDYDISTMSRLPKIKTILGRYHYLQAQSKKSSNSLCDIVGVEVHSLWMKLSLEPINVGLVKLKVRNLINQYKKCLKNNHFDMEYE